MKTRHLITASLLALGALAAHANINSSFNNGLEGWTGAGGTVSYGASGGNGGGYLVQTDTMNTWMSVSAPAAFLGNLSTYSGGVLSFDVKNISNHASDLQSGPWFGAITITGAAGSASRNVAGAGAGLPLADGLWRTYSTTLSPALWSGNLAAVLANTTAITLTLEFNNAIVETAGLDNFQIAAVPEPATAVLMGAGVMVLVRQLRRRETAGRSA
jgi:hypothetical protein